MVSEWRAGTDVEFLGCPVWPEKDDEYQVAIVDLPALPEDFNSHFKARLKTLTDTGKLPPP